MKSLTINGCQGVGDLTWCVQKFYPYVDEININICYVHGNAQDKHNNRAVEFVKLLPKVNKIGMKQISEASYQKLASARFSMKDILENLSSDQEYDYACNGPLEKGTRIEEIDPEYLPAKKIEVKCVECPLAFLPKQFVTVYVSGATLHDKAIEKHKLWSVLEWFKFIALLGKKFNFYYPIIIIDASYDRDVALQLEYMLKRNGFPHVHTYIDACPMNITYILRESILFIGYQSGLNILADMLDTKQIMIYFPYLEPMLYTWCKKESIKSKFFADTFNHKPEQVIRNLTTLKI
jgi:hypothetical protein